MKNIKAIFIDSEGTLRNKNKEINLETSDIIKKLESIGIHVIITTGLPRFLSRNISLKANASRYLISSNGSDIYDLDKNKSINNSYIDTEIVKNIYNLSNNNYNLILGVGEYEYSNILNEYNLNAKKILDIEFLKEKIFQIHLSQRIFDSNNTSFFKEIKDFFKYYDKDILKLLIGEPLFLKLCNFNKLDENEVKIIIRAIRYIKLYSLRNEILKEYGNYVVIGNQSHDFTEFQKDGETPWFSLNKKGINKGYAINFLCDYLNINLKDTVGIGNDYNDKTMQKAVGTFICPNNARDFLKEDTKIIYDDLEEVNKVLKKIYEKR